jgi:hypothetical protein
MQSVAQAASLPCRQTQQRTNDAIIAAQHPLLVQRMGWLKNRVKQRGVSSANDSVMRPPEHLRRGCFALAPKSHQLRDREHRIAV